MLCFANDNDFKKTKAETTEIVSIVQVLPFRTSVSPKMTNIVRAGFTWREEIELLPWPKRITAGNECSSGLKNELSQTRAKSDIFASFD
jgi:hypothetical protein